MSINENDYDKDIILLTNANFHNDLSNLIILQLNNKNENFDTIISNLLDWYEKYESD